MSAKQGQPEGRKKDEAELTEEELRAVAGGLLSVTRTSTPTSTSPDKPADTSTTANPDRATWDQQNNIGV